MARWDGAGIPYKEGKFLATLILSDGDLDTIAVWPDKQVAVCETVDKDEAARFDSLGWQILNANEDPETILHALHGGN